MKNNENFKNEFLLDMLEYYNGHPERRCVEITKKGTTCSYTPDKVSKVGISEGCAIGRKLPREIAFAFDNGFEVSDNVIATIYEIGSIHDLKYDPVGDEQYTALDILKMKFSNVPEWLTLDNVKFLSHVQALHDENNNWDENGLTETGRSELRDILRIFDLNSNLYNKYLVNKSLKNESSNESS